MVKDSAQLAQLLNKRVLPAITAEPLYESVLAWMTRMAIVAETMGQERRPSILIRRP